MEILQTERNAIAPPLESMASYFFTVRFPNNPPISLYASSDSEAARMQQALVNLNAEYIIRAPTWIGGCFKMTAEAWAKWNRLTGKTKDAAGQGSPPYR